MVGLQTLDLAIGVRVPASQPNRINQLRAARKPSRPFCVPIIVPAEILGSIVAERNPTSSILKDMRKLTIFSAAKSASVELNCFDLEHDDPSIIGMSVKIKDLGFSGINFMLGVELSALADFVSQVKELDETRTGSAHLTTRDVVVNRDVDKFDLWVRNYDSSGHFRLDYRVETEGEGVGHEHFLHKLSGGFRLDSGCITQIVSDCQAFESSAQKLSRKIRRRLITSGQAVSEDY